MRGGGGDHHHEYNVDRLLKTTSRVVYSPENIVKPSAHLSLISSRLHKSQFYFGAPRLMGEPPLPSQVGGKIPSLMGLRAKLF